MFSFGVHTFAFLNLLGFISTLRLNSPIVGGIKCNITEFPFIVSLRINNDQHGHRCGCSILNDRWLLTAAHCVFEKKPSDLDVHYGFTIVSHHLNNCVEIDDIVIHEKYDPENFYNDIALIKVTPALPLSTIVHPVKLAQKRKRTAIEMATVIGWGSTKSGGSASRSLRKVKIQLYSKKICKKKLEGRFQTTQLCGGDDKGGKDSCQGDSGGPLMQEGEQIGVVSWGDGCGIPESPGVYTEVASYIDWISDNVPHLKKRS